MRAFGSSSGHLHFHLYRTKWLVLSYRMIRILFSDKAYSLSSVLPYDQDAFQ